MIAERLHQIREAIKTRTDRPIDLLAVTKLQPLEKIKEAIGLGMTRFGNNYVQEGEALREALTADDFETLRWHFIGHIQSRKAKSLLGYDCIETIDRFEVAQKIAMPLHSLGQKKSILIEVNLGREPQKSGVHPEELPAFIEKLLALSVFSIDGLMTLPPPLFPIKKRRPFFTGLKTMRDRLSSITPLPVLSMGTSEDYLIAIEEGATQVRLGTALFGERRVK